MPEPKRPLKVFLCHAHADRDAVRPLYAHLTQAGVDVWLDKEKLLPGQDWELEIRKAVRVSDVVVVCLSKQFNQAGFRQKEVRWALDTAMEQPKGEIFIIPARLEECETHEDLRKWHWVDLFEADGYERLVGALRARADKIGATLQIKKSSFFKANAQPPTVRGASPAKRSVEQKQEISVATNGKTRINYKTVAAVVVMLVLVSIFGLFLLLDSFEKPTQVATSNSPGCNPNADVLLQYALDQSDTIASALGTPTRTSSRCIWSSYQSFERGEMIWRSDSSDIDVLYSSGEWQVYQNSFIYNTEVPCNVEAIPENRHQPLLGFGKIWCENQKVREKLGYATIGERADNRAILTFENGWLMLIDYTVRAVFYDKKQWESVDVFDFAQISLESRTDLDTKVSNLGLEKEESITIPKSPLTVLDPVTGKSLFVPFRVGSKVSTQCADNSTHPVVINISVNISHPIRVYLLVQAGWGVKSYEYRQIGNVLLKFDNGKPLDTPLTLGLNIRDWADRSVAITTLNSPYTQTAWEGFDGVPGKIDILVLDIPENYTSSTLEEIQITDTSNVDTGNTEGNMDPCIHLSAVTVSYLQLP